MDDAGEELVRYERARDLCTAPNLMGSREMLRAAQLRPDWLVPELVPARDLVLITGAPGAKKSWLAYSLAVAVAQGGTWLGASITPRTAKREGVAALVLNYDNSTSECGRRFARLGLRAEDSIQFHSPELGDPLLLPDKAEELAMMCDHLAPRLVLVDSLRQAHTAEENSSKEMRVVMKALKRLYACGATVIVVHHAGKSVGEVSKSRGSEEIDASATGVIYVGKEREGVASATWDKHRSWQVEDANKTRYFRVEDHGDLTRVERAEPPAKKERKRA